MKKIAVLILALLPTLISYTQDSRLGADCNPALNQEETLFLDSALAANNYSFKNKTIGFAGKTGFGAGYSNQLLPITKKEYFTTLANDRANKYTSRLAVLTDEQKQLTNGFDAIVLLASQKEVHKATPAVMEKLVKVFSYRQLNYPPALEDAAIDTNPELGSATAAFFNRVYEHKRKDFDFTGKKIAIIDDHAAAKADKRKTNRQYIDKIRKHLESDFLYPTDYLYILTEEEKKQSGGYDAVIVYVSKQYNMKEVLDLVRE